MPADFDRYSSDWEFVSKAELRAALVDFFDLSYPSDAPFRPRGRIQTCTGADVFTATFRPRQGPRGKADQNTNDTSGPPFAGVLERILITDSNPQYMCLSFDFQQAP